MRIAAAFIALFVVAGVASAAEPPALMRARTLYNAGDYDGAITAATGVRAQVTAADAAALIEARAHLERYRIGGEADDLSAARDALGTVRMAMLSPRDQIDLLVGIGQSLYFSNLFGPAANFFDSALDRGAILNHRDRTQLLDWWATALDREAQASAPDRRARLAAQITMRMEDELRLDPGSAPANYWLAVAAREAGDIDAAWDAAVAAWVRAPFGLYAMQIRTDIDRLVTSALIPERARARSTGDPVDETETLLAEWESIKQNWR
jgi:hypothetical protein